MKHAQKTSQPLPIAHNSQTPLETRAKAQHSEHCGRFCADKKNFRIQFDNLKCALRKKLQNPEKENQDVTYKKLVGINMTVNYCMPRKSFTSRSFVRVRH